MTYCIGGTYVPPYFEIWKFRSMKTYKYENVQHIL